MADDIAKELDGYLQRIPTAGEAAYVEAVTEVVTAAAQDYAAELRRTAPRSKTADGRQHMADTIVVEPEKRTGRVGYTVAFDGYDERGKPFQLIANSLNKGVPTDAHSGFMSRARRRTLRGIDAKIAKEFEEKLDEKMKGG